jgi:hypothetical protein
MTFLVLAPPRSMTAWLANMLTTESTVCHHDVLVHGGLPRMRTLSGAAGVEVGFAETGGLAIPLTLLGAFPNARIVVIQSEPARVGASLTRIGIDGDAFIREAGARIGRAMSLPGHAMFVRDTEVLDRAGDISEYLIGRRPSEARLSLLRTLRVVKSNPLHGDPKPLRELIERES